MKLSGTWLHYSPENSPLPGAGAWPIAFDSKNRAWMCVGGKSEEKLGIVVFDGQNWIHYLPGYAGIPDQPIFGMVGVTTQAVTRLFHRTPCIPS